MKLKYLYLISYTILSLINITFKAQKPDTCPKIGYVLSGGGAKGYAHIGALLELEKNHIYPDLIGGTSMGSIVGGLYATGYTAKQLDSLIYQINFEQALISAKERKLIPLFDKNYAEKYVIQLPLKNFKIKIPNALSKGQGSIKIMNSLTKHVHNITNFDSLSTPFFCIATDLKTGEQVILRKGSLSRSIAASSALPTIIEPQFIDGKLLVDGGVVNNFPAKEVRERGMDIVIGIDVQSDSVNLEKLKSAQNLIKHLSTLINKKKQKDQYNEVDVLLNVDITGYETLDFNKKTEIINRGREIAKIQMQQILARIPESCRMPDNPRVIKHDIHQNDTIYISTLDIRGAKDHSTNYLLSKIRLNLPEKTTYKTIEKSVDRLYATGNFDRINYTISNDTYGKKITYDIEESEYKSYLKMGIHYDDLYKTGILLNYSLKNFLWKDTYFSADFVFGDRFRTEINFLIDNGMKPSYGFNYAYKSVLHNTRMEIKDTNGVTIPAGEYDFDNHSTDFFIESNYFNRISIGLGAEYDYLRISEKNDLFDKDDEILSNHIVGATAFLKMDDRDKPYFTKKGVKIDSEVKYILYSEYENKKFEPSFYLNLNAEMSFPLFWTKLALTFDIGLGMNFSDHELPMGQKFIIGGLNQQKFLNTRPMPGYKFGGIVTDNYFLLGNILQYQVYKNIYLQTFFYKENHATDYLDIQYLDLDDNNGIGASLGYDSPLGPIRATYAYSPSLNEDEFYLSIGFWF